MKLCKLILWRHAKSDWSVECAHDHDRPLNRRGEVARHVMAAYIKQNFSPDMIVCSTAKRACETLAAFDTDKKVIFDETLYHAMPATITSLVHQYGGTYNTLMMVGHNPGFEILAAKQSGTKPSISKMIGAKFPTCAVACICFGGQWNDFSSTIGAVTDFATPKIYSSDN